MQMIKWNFDNPNGETGSLQQWRIEEENEEDGDFQKIQVITTEEHAVLRVKHRISSSWKQEVRNVKFIWTELKTYVLRCKSAIYRFVSMNITVSNEAKRKLWDGLVKYQVLKVIAHPGHSHKLSWPNNHPTNNYWFKCSLIASGICFSLLMRLMTY